MTPLFRLALCLPLAGCADPSGAASETGTDGAAHNGSPSPGGSSSETAADADADPLGPSYCAGDPVPEAVMDARAFPGNGTIQIEFGSALAESQVVLDCEDPYPGCHDEWEAVVPIPRAEPGIYGTWDRIHRRFFGPEQCGGPSPARSESVEDTELVLYEVEPNCVSGAIRDPLGIAREFIATICEERD